MRYDEELAPGTIVGRIVGVPGPDVDHALVMACLAPGKHLVRGKCWGQGDWYEVETTAELFHGRAARWQANPKVISMLEAERDRIFPPAITGDDTARIKAAKRPHVDRRGPVVLADREWRKGR